MCGVSERLSADEAGKKLARLMERQLGYPEGHIDNVALRLFVRAYWSQVSMLAHVIHDDVVDRLMNADNREDVILPRANG